MISYPNKVEQIAIDRGKSYGPYIDSIYKINILKGGITLTPSTMDSLSENRLFELREGISFGKTMMALKAGRSITAKGEVYEDCIIDFIAYLNLTLKEVIKDTGIKIEFNSLFNPILNKENVKVDEVEWLVNTDEVLALMSKMKNKG